MCVIGAVKALMRVGINPTKRVIDVYSWVYTKDGNGLTGQNLVRQHEVARYDQRSGGVKWQPSSK